jgi:hypothetical protein
MRNSLRHEYGNSGEFSKGIAETHQNGITQIEGLENGKGRLTLGLAEVLAVHSDRNTCDVDYVTKVYNVPVLTKGGLVDGEVYGELDLPNIGDMVIIGSIAEDENRLFIMSSIIPYLYSKFQAGQVTVNSASKAHTKTFLEANKSKTYKKIFKSGSTWEVKEDGTIIWETPSGGVITLDGASGQANINGNLTVDV